MSPRTRFGFGHDRVGEMLEFVGLSADADRKAGDYSKGMRQRLALAAALLGDPELLVLDEPLDGLDPAGQHAFRARLKNLASEGRTVIVSSHALVDIEEMADHVVVVGEGRLVTQGRLEDLLEGSKTRVRVDNPRDAAAVLDRANIAASVEDNLLYVDTDDGSEIIRTLAAAGIFPHEVAATRSTLESVFLGLTGTDVR